MMVSLLDARRLKISLKGRPRRLGFCIVIQKKLPLNPQVDLVEVLSNKLILSEVAMIRNGVGLASLQILQETRRLRLWSSVPRPRQPNFVPRENNFC